MKSVINQLLGHCYEPLNLIKIDASALIQNYRCLSRLSDVKIAPVLKSNAYGHGLSLVAKILDGQGAPFYCVDSLFEAYELLKEKVKTPILIMGYINPISLKTKKLPFHFAVYDFDVLCALAKYQPEANIHLFLDTGMHREGIAGDDLAKFLDYFKSHPKLKLVGIMSHLACADKPSHPLTKKQVKLFNFYFNFIKSRNFHPVYSHLCSSQYLLNSRNIPGDIARCGLALYGLNPIKINPELKPVLEFISHVSQIKLLKKGDTVGYNAMYTATKPVKISVLPAGYQEGIDLRLSGKGYVSFAGNYCRLLGRINMNLSVADVSRIKNIRVKDECIIISASPNSRNSVYHISRQIGTSPYEILVHLNSSIKRIIVNR